MVRSACRRCGGVVGILLWILPAKTCGWGKGARPASGALARDRRGVVLAAAGDLGAQPDQRVVLAAGHPFLHRDQRIVGDLDVLRTDLGAALGDVAVAEAEVVLGDLAPVGGVGRV